MLTYYIGNIREKRFLFRKYRADAARADNCDVLADFKWNGKVCFVLGDIPFGQMRVAEYLRYARALGDMPKTQAEAERLLRKVGVKVPLDKKMARLPREVFRAIVLAAALRPDTREVWINLDGVAYTPFACARVRKMLSAMAKNFDRVHASVSDCRFIPKRANVLTAANGTLAPGRTSSSSRRMGRLRFCRAQREKSLEFASLGGRKTLLCDN